MDMAFTENLTPLSRNGEEIQPDICLSSLRDASCLLQQFGNSPDASFRKRLVASITDPANRISGSYADYHNFIMDLFDLGDYALALQVCDHALAAMPCNRELLGDAIMACGADGQFERGEQYLQRAEVLPYRLWNFRLFLCSVDFLKNKLCAYPMDEGLFLRALTLADEYIRNLPFDERGYNQKAELLLMMNERQRAIGELKRYIFDTAPDVLDSRSELITSQCCVTLLKLLDNSNDYDFIIQICDRGLRNTAQEQPAAQIGYFVFKKALAMDAKAHIQNFEVPTTVNAALKLYQAAYDLNRNRLYESTIEERYAVLRPYSQEDRPLLRRELSEPTA